MTDAEAKAALAELMAEYANLIDDDRLEDWLDLFAEECSYRVVPRENFDLGLPQPLILAENKAMLTDRVVAYRNANIYNIHRDRHVVGTALARKGEGERWTLTASFALFQTDSEGRTSLFVAGQYRATASFEAARPRLHDMLVLLDTAAIPTLLATPV
jgi:anthranilate 1,2-dioxygenase small subunit